MITDEIHNQNNLLPNQYENQIDSARSLQESATDYS